MKDLSTLFEFKYSRGLLDKMIYMNFINQKTNDGIMIEIGGHTGDAGGSNTYFFEKYLGFKTILIEPGYENFTKMVKNRPDSININKAVSYNSEIIKLYGDNETATTWKEQKGRKTTFVQGEPIRNILENHNLKYVDLFVIDTEGSELTVLETFDWNIEVGVILIELLSQSTSGKFLDHLEKDKKVIEFLQMKGFTYQFSDGGMTNLIWTNDKYSRKDVIFEGVRNTSVEYLKNNHYLKREYAFKYQKDLMRPNN